MTSPTSHGPRYRQLPLWRDAMRLLVEVENAVRHFPRYHKYTLGSDLRRQFVALWPALAPCRSWLGRECIANTHSIHPGEFAMSPRSFLFALAICLSTASHTAHAVTCAANMPASNPDAAYTDHGDGTVTHIPTGLMWKRCSEGQSWNGGTCAGTASIATWAQALTLGSTSSFAGQTDWRLPNLKELRSLVEECRFSPAINDTVFLATPSSHFWSGSPDAYHSSYAWEVNFYDGYAYSSYRSSGVGVRLVRGGQSFGSFDSSNGNALNVTTLNFAAQNLGTTSAAQTVTLNNGKTPLNIASIVATGDYAVMHNCGMGLGSGGFCTLNITFTPTATGTRTGTVTLTDDSIFSTKTISLTGTGQGAVASLSTTAMTFASQNQGSSSAAQTITLTNTGVAVLNIASIVASGEFARTTTCGATLAMGANCTLSVTFRPTAVGARSGGLVITSNANSSPDTISLSGTGLAAPVVSLNPASLAFAAQTVGTSSAAKTIALTNTGGAALNLTSITASGDFAVTNNCGAGLGAGGSCNLSVTFTPTVAGTRTGAITITSNAAGSPHNASLSNIPKTNQTIGAISLSPTTLVAGSITTASASATSGLAVSFTSATPGVCTVSGSTVTGIAVGACTIAADQAGDATYNAAAQVTQIIAISTASQAVVEFYNTNLDNYFITADASEAAAIDSGSAGQGWSRTGNTFKSGGSTSVCRFYGSQSPGPNSHFYTVDPGECAYLKQLQASTPATKKRWNFESLDFVSTAPTNGACSTGTTPVYRAYNNGFARGVDSNHRITSSPAAIQEVVTRGWNSEGVVMCAPN